MGLVNGSRLGHQENTRRPSVQHCGSFYRGQNRNGGPGGSTGSLEGPVSMETKSFLLVHCATLSPSVLEMGEREIPMQIKQNVFISK